MKKSINFQLSKSGAWVRTLFILLLLFIAGDKSITTSYAQTSKELKIEEWLQYSKAPHYGFTVAHTYPHDSHNFTEGFILDNGFLYESAGLYGQSKLQQIELTSGKILRELRLPVSYFAEGIAIIDKNIYQLTYKEHIAFVYDKNTFKLKNQFHYSSEGWGLTTDGKHLLMSDGSDQIAFLNPLNFKVIKKLVVTDEQHHIYSLNSMAYIHGKIYANIWPSNIIAIISPVSGKVEAWLDIHEFNTQLNCSVSSCAANGIAYDEKNDMILLTGKNWLHTFAIRLQQ